MSLLSRYRRYVAYFGILAYIALFVTVHMQLNAYSRRLFNPSLPVGGGKGVERSGGGQGQAALLSPPQDAWPGGGNRTVTVWPVVANISKGSTRYISTTTKPKSAGSLVDKLTKLRQKFDNRNKTKPSKPSKTKPTASKIPLWHDMTKVRGNRVEKCDGKIKVYEHLITMFSDLLLDPAKCDPKGKGGENISDVMSQKEEKEFLSPQPGCFSLQCGGEVALSSNDYITSFLPSHYKSWLKSITFDSDLTKQSQDTSYSTNFIVAVVRYEYANVYWNVMDIYNVFLTAALNNVSIQDTDILIMDAHPKSHLDKIWLNVFNSVKRPSDLTNPVKYKTFSWLFGRGASPILNKTTRSPPKWFDFRKLVLSRNQIRDDHTRVCYDSTGDTVSNVKSNISDKSLNSSEASGPKLRILLIWRRDYVAHPRNPSGLVMRKIKNEAELERSLRTAFPSYIIRGVQLDKLSIEEQLYLISHSDILIGMHGAAMAFNFMMPPSSAVIELYPSYYKTANWHMEYIATWTGHTYKKWANKNVKLDDSKKGYTTVPTHEVVKLVKSVTSVLCPK